MTIFLYCDGEGGGTWLENICLLANLDSPTDTLFMDTSTVL